MMHGHKGRAGHTFTQMTQACGRAVPHDHALLREKNSGPRRRRELNKQHGAEHIEKVSVGRRPYGMRPPSPPGNRTVTSASRQGSSAYRPD